MKEYSIEEEEQEYEKIEKENQATFKRLRKQMKCKYCSFDCWDEHKSLKQMDDERIQHFRTKHPEKIPFKL